MPGLTSLFLILMLQFTATNGKLLSFTVRNGDKVTLPCEDLTDNRDPCDNTTWIFQNSKNKVKLFENGTIQDKAQSDRLSLTVSCSLLLKTVTVDDVGLYVCNHKPGEEGLDRHSTAYLFVVTMTEQKAGDSVTFTCSVSSLVWCNPTVRWLFDGNRTGFTDSEISPRHCSDSVTLASHLSRRSELQELLKCIVEYSYSTAVHRFTFNPQSSDKDETIAQMNEKTSEVNNKFSTNQEKPTKQDSPHGLRCIVVSVGLAALVISVVTVVVWTKTKGNRTQVEESPVCLNVKRFSL